MLDFFIFSVPNEPIDVKAIIKGTNKALMLWHPSLETNGHILNYTIYYRIKGSEPKIGKVLASRTEYEIFGLKPNETYEFWVTASTKNGEGPSSMYITKITSIDIAPQIASYGNQFTVNFNESVELPCDAVGSPWPYVTWKVCLIDFLRIFKISNPKSFLFSNLR